MKLGVVAGGGLKGSGELVRDLVWGPGGMG